MGLRQSIGYCRTRFFAGTAILATLAFGMSATPVSAETCMEEVQRLADVYGLVVDPPDIPSAQSQDPLTSQDLAESGGLIEPPPTGDRLVIEPPDSATPRMPTVPDITPGSPPADKVGANALTPTDVAILQSMLIAARGEAERGQEADCFERLQKAQKFVARQSG